MKLLHTGDWHLGKHLEGYSRLEEQKEFIDELTMIVEQEGVDMILITGDIYDTVNPPAEAEKLFYRAMRDLSNNGERIITIIAGNHDSPNRLIASSPLVHEQGIIIMDRPNCKVNQGLVGNYKVVDSGQGFIELEINDENVVLLGLPYPSERRLNEVLTETDDERVLQKEYSKKVGEIFSTLEEKYRQDTINIAMSHIFVMGGDTSQSERPIQVGGGLTVGTEDLPANSQYTALGHLHRSQSASKEKNAYYAGSPVQYSVSERNNVKSVNIVEIKPEQEAEIKKINLSNSKPIEVWDVNGIEEAIDKCEENFDRPVWAYLKIKTDRSLLQSEIKQLKKIKPDILSIEPIISKEDEVEDNLTAMEELDIMELFEEYYKKKKEVEPEEEVLRMFTQIVNDEEDQYAS